VHFQESAFQSCLYGVVDTGKDPVEQLTKIVELRNIMAGVVRAMGTLTGVELIRLKDGSWQDVPLGEGEYQIIHFNGHVARVGSSPALRVEVLLAVDGPAGTQLVHGHLKAAEVIEFEYALTAFDDVHAERRLDAGLLRLADIKANQGFIPPVTQAATATAPAKTQPSEPAPDAPQRPVRGPVERIAEPRLGRVEDVTPKAAPRPVRPEPEEEPEDEPQTSTSWADVVEASSEASKSTRQGKRPLPTPKSRKAPEYDDDRALIEPGDILDHPTLGRCRIMRIEDEDFAHIRLERGGIRKLALEVCEISHVKEEGNRNIFKVKIKR